MLEPFSEHAQREDLSFGGGFVCGRAIREHAGKLRNLRKPTAVFFKLGFDAQMHGVMVARAARSCTDASLTTQQTAFDSPLDWVPACAGMTLCGGVSIYIQAPEMPPSLQPGQQR